MITTEEISQVAYRMLRDASISGQLSLSQEQIDYERTDYTSDGIVIVPHTIDGEDSLRFGQVNVNIHVPDIVATDGEQTVTRTDIARLVHIRSEVIEILKNHVEPGTGWNWYIGRLNPPIKETNHDEHFVSLALEVTVREKNN